MAVNMQDVRAWLDQEETDYMQARKLGPEALPLLMQLVQGGDPGLASKATYLASLIASDRAADVVQAAAASHDPVVRVAAASAIRNLTEAHAGRVLETLKADPDPGVRKVALKSVADFRSPLLLEKVQHMAEQDPEPFVRELAQNTIRRMR